MTSTIAILGGEGRLGKILATYFIRKGFLVVSLDQLISGRRSNKRHFIKCDLSDYASILKSSQEAVDLTGGIDHCINAIRHRGSDASAYAEMATEFMVEVAGPHTWIDTIRVSQMPHILQSVVHISSVLATSSSMKESVAYHCAKGALDSLVRWEALAWGKSGTKVNAVSPGYIDYGSKDNSVKTGADPVTNPISNEVKNSHALQMPASPFAVCQLTEFILYSDGVTGQVIRIDAGSSVLEPLGVALRYVESRNK